MSAANNLQFTWKRMAEEREETARNLARIAIGLFVACNVLAFTTYSGHARFGNLCNRIDGINPALARSIDNDLVASLEAVRAQCQ